MTQMAREAHFEGIAKAEIVESQSKFLKENQVQEHYPLTQDLGDVGLGTGITFIKNAGKGQILT